MRPRIVRRRQDSAGSIAQFRAAWLAGCRALVIPVLCALASQPIAADQAQREAFREAWQSAASGDRVAFEQALTTLADYRLYPYLQYEDLRNRRRLVAADAMAGFLDAHREWAFTAGLERTWLRALGEGGRWGDLLAYGGASEDTEVRCHHAQARIQAGETAGLLADAQALWAVGRSQPEACDPVFRWLQQQGGITPGLAWERVRRAMDERHPRLVLYLARFLPEAQRPWVDRWYRQDSDGYRRLDQAANWPDGAEGRDITEYGLRRLARQDADRAWRFFPALEARFDWGPERRSGILREIALWSAVAGSPETPARMRAVPDGARDDRLLEWWARAALAAGDWQELLDGIGRMSPQAADDARWRYWKARALSATGAAGEAEALLRTLAEEASYHGFLAADRLQLPYAICPEPPAVPPDQVAALAAREDFARALELRQVGIDNWARAEWSLAVRRQDAGGLRAAAALAVGEGWSDQAIFALGNSGDTRWYEWRFPLDYRGPVESNARDRQLDPSWVMGLMRSESAMAADAISSAGARGLMQVTPATARQLARRHAIAYGDAGELLEPETNIRFGTAYLRDLLDRFSGSAVFASGAYNAGPGAVERWLKERPADDPEIWIETLPYFETRDYIPRVLAFATLYDWRLQRPLTRVSTRLKSFDSVPVGGTIRAQETAEVACSAPG